LAWLFVSQNLSHIGSQINTYLDMTCLLCRFVQFIETKSVAEVLHQFEGSIQNFFRKHHPNDDEPYGIDRNVMDTYVKVILL